MVATNRKMIPPESFATMLSSRATMLSILLDDRPGRTKAIGSCNGVEVDPQVRRQLPNGRQLGALRQFPARDQFLDPIGNLLVDRARIGGIDGQERRTPVPRCRRVLFWNGVQSREVGKFFCDVLRERKNDAARTNQSAARADKNEVFHRLLGHSIFGG